MLILIYYKSQKTEDVRFVGFKTDLSDSAYDFIHIVYPKLVECNFIMGDIVPIESVTAMGITKDLDMFAGIDAWHIYKDCGIQGVASRVQWGHKAWNSFTIRKHRANGTETEYAKRKRAIYTGDWLYPILTIQAYITSRRDGELLSVGVAKTKDIFDAIADGNCYDKENRYDGNTFCVVEWKNMDNIDVWERDVATDQTANI